MLRTLRSVLRLRRIELDAVERRLASVASVEDLRRIARRRLPGGVFDYIDGAAEDELTLRRNTEAFHRLEFRPRVLRDVSQIRTESTVLGQPLPLPLVLAPTGFTRIADPPGELAVARAAARAGLPYALSTLSTRSIEEVATASADGRRWFQVYVWRDRGLVREMLERARAAGGGLHLAAEARARHAARRRAAPGLDVELLARRADRIRQRHWTLGRRR